MCPKSHTSWGEKPRFQLNSLAPELPSTLAHYVVPLLSLALDKLICFHNFDDFTRDDSCNDHLHVRSQFQSCQIHAFNFLFHPRVRVSQTELISQPKTQPSFHILCQWTTPCPVAQAKKSGHPSLTSLSHTPQSNAKVYYPITLISLKFVYCSPSSITNPRSALSPDVGLWA